MTTGSLTSTTVHEMAILLGNLEDQEGWRDAYWPGGEPAPHVGIEGESRNWFIGPRQAEGVEGLDGVYVSRDHEAVFDMVYRGGDCTGDVETIDRDGGLSDLINRVSDYIESQSPRMTGGATSPDDVLCDGDDRVLVRHVDEPDRGPITLVDFAREHDGNRPVLEDCVPALRRVNPGRRVKCGDTSWERVPAHGFRVREDADCLNVQIVQWVGDNGRPKTDMLAVLAGTEFQIAPWRNGGVALHIVETAPNDVAGDFEAEMDKFQSIPTGGYLHTGFVEGIFRLGPDMVEGKVWGDIVDALEGESYVEKLD